MMMEYLGRLPQPMEIREQYPVPEKAAEVKKALDREVADVFTGKSSRFILVIGPCSADHEEPVLDYISRLRRVQEDTRDKLLIIPRIYTNKPRTTGEGYKGMLHSPEPTQKPNLIKGLVAIRKLHMKCLTDYGFGSADEMLYPDNYHYLSDLLSYVAVGARSVENQQHRLLSSGVSVPVGMKNPTGGDLSIMMNAIYAAQHSHVFATRGWEVQSHGNPLCHAILRGYVDKQGKSFPNYHYEDLMALHESYASSSLLNPACIVDCNHANSGKKYLEQVRIAKEVLHARRHSGDLERLVKGLMIESYIEDGSQKVGQHCYGQSITDPCLGWDKTRDLLYAIADAL